VTAERVRGLAAAFSTLDALPVAARGELQELLVDIGLDLLAAERRDVPKDTGNLYRTLTAVIEELRVRVGLIGAAARSRSALRRARKSGNADPRNYGAGFYGRIVNFGRRAQTVVVQRRRRVNGALRSSRGRKRAEDIAATYTMHVRARAAVPFITGQQFLQNRLAQRVANFWASALARTGGSAA